MCKSSMARPATAYVGKLSWKPLTYRGFLLVTVPYPSQLSFYPKKQWFKVCSKHNGNDGWYLTVTIVYPNRTLCAGRSQQSVWASVLFWAEAPSVHCVHFPCWPPRKVLFMVFLFSRKSALAMLRKKFWYQISTTLQQLCCSKQTSGGVDSVNET